MDKNMFLFVFNTDNRQQDVGMRTHRPCIFSFKMKAVDKS